MTLNRSLIEQVADHIAANHDRFGMDTYISDGPDDPIAIRDNAQTCGTTCCIAGWAVALSTTRQFNRAIKMAGIDAHDPDVVAATLLGMDYDDATALFHATHMGPDEAVGVLRTLAKTGELDIPCDCSECRP